MDATEILACHGKTEDDSAIIELFKKLGVTKRPKLVDFVASIELKDRGLRLALMPAGAKSSKLKLTSIAFHSDSEKGYTPFAGRLPRGLTFDDSQAEARVKLGQPTTEIDWARLDHWIDGNHQLSVQYRRDQDRIAKVSFSFKPEDD